jgi:16S rRNA (cytosine1402-N4)-methyltransferase
MLDEAMALLRPRPGGVYCDATLGGGGHAERVLELSAPDGRLVGIDRDGDALARAGHRLRPFGDRVRLVHGNYADAARLLREIGCVPVDGFLLDLGLSSDQLQDADRGFSFTRPGPLDMRMDRTRPGTAADLLRYLGVDDLTRLLATWGEQPSAPRIARAIRREVEAGRLDSTAALATVVARSAPGPRGRVHPATRVFQALRIAVNDELGGLASFLRDFCELLRPGGRVVIIAFHSLEDRLVKQRLRELSSRSGGQVLALLTRRALRPGPAELQANPRARSARMRAAERVASEASA